jgi:hypothetical protein
MPYCLTPVAPTSRFGGSVLRRPDPLLEAPTGLAVCAVGCVRVRVQISAFGPCSLHPALTQPGPVAAQTQPPSSNVDYCTITTTSSRACHGYRLITRHTRTHTQAAALSAGEAVAWNCTSPWLNSRHYFDSRTRRDSPRPLLPPHLISARRTPILLPLAH